MENCTPISTPIELKIDTQALTKGVSDIDKERYPCRTAIGSLMYSMLCSQPDLSYFIEILSLFQLKPSKALWKLIKRILHYVRGTFNFKLKFMKNNPYQIPQLLCIQNKQLLEKGGSGNNS